MLPLKQSLFILKEQDGTYEMMLILKFKKNLIIYLSFFVKIIHDNIEIVRELSPIVYATTVTKKTVNKFSGVL